MYRRVTICFTRSSSTGYRVPAHVKKGLATLTRAVATTRCTSPPRDRPIACSPFFSRSGAVLVGPNNGGIDHHVFVIVITRQQFENALENSALCPPAVSETGRWSISASGSSLTTQKSLGTLWMMTRTKRSLRSWSISSTTLSRTSLLPRRTLLSMRWSLPRRNWNQTQSGSLAPPTNNSTFRRLPTRQRCQRR